MAQVTENSEVGSYADVTFPFETEFAAGDGKVRLYGVMQSQVFGVSYYPDTGHGEALGQPLNWDLQGKFGQAGQSYPTMDLMPPPGAAMAEYCKIQDQIAEAQTRLDDNLGAPAEWRAVDERRVAALRDKASKLEGVFRADAKAA